jgi:23S rRNA G2445 N2-methylase RlmL
VNFFEKEDFAFLKFMKFDFSEIDKLGKEENNIHALDNLFRNVDAAKKNAKIAGINKSINFSRMDVEWLDTKFDSKSVDRIVTCMPNISKNTDEKSVLKVYNEFFYQAEFVLKKGGSILVCTLNPDEVKKAASEKGFNVEFEREVRQGEEKLNLIKLEKE